MKKVLLLAPLLAAAIAACIYLFGAAVISPWRPASMGEVAWNQCFGFAGLIIGCIVANRWVRRAKNREKQQNEQH
jgi:hypothetical protein